MNLEIIGSTLGILIASFDAENNQVPLYFCLSAATDSTYRFIALSDGDS